MAHEFCEIGAVKHRAELDAERLFVMSETTGHGCGTQAASAEHAFICQVARIQPEHATLLFRQLAGRACRQPPFIEVGVCKSKHSVLERSAGADRLLGCQMADLEMLVHKKQLMLVTQHCEVSRPACERSSVDLAKPRDVCERGKSSWGVKRILVIAQRAEEVHIAAHCDERCVVLKTEDLAQLEKLGLVVQQWLAAAPHALLTQLAKGPKPPGEELRTAVESRHMVAPHAYADDSKF